MTLPSKRYAPKAPKDEKLPWEKLYQACLERAAYPQENEWDEQAQLEIKILEERFGEVLRTPPEITLELLASTAVALLPAEGLDETNVVQRAYDLLVLCRSRLALGKRAQEELAAINRRQRERRKLGKVNPKSKLTQAVKTITGRESASDAKHYFRAFLEVFYGEVAFEETRGLQMLSSPPLMSFPIEEGKNKDWARDTYERYRVRGLREDEVVFLNKKYKELTEGGFFDEKSTQPPLSRTIAKKKKQEAS